VPKREKRPFGHVEGRTCNSLPCTAPATTRRDRTAHPAPATTRKGPLRSTAASAPPKVGRVDPRARITASKVERVPDPLFAHDPARRPDPCVRDMGDRLGPPDTCGRSPPPRAPARVVEIPFDKAQLRRAVQNRPRRAVGIGDRDGKLDLRIVPLEPGQPLGQPVITIVWLATSESRPRRSPSQSARA
jgi:hypothetical protein